MAMTHPEVQRQIDRRRHQAAEEYPRVWRRLITSWRAEACQDAAWLLYSANYLLRTQSVRWAIDPLTLGWRVPGAPPVPVERDLADLSFVVLTHRHADHLDFDLIRSLNRLPILWIVPESLRLRLATHAGLRRDRMEAARPNMSFQIGPVCVTIFSGVHDERPQRAPAGSHSGRRRTVPSLALTAEFGGKCWLFPGDTRTYAAHRAPNLNRLDGVFAHVWLGHGRAQDPAPPLLTAFCRYFLGMGPRRIVLAHLEEYGRDASDFWGLGQAARVRQRLRDLDGSVPVEIARMGDCVGL